MKRFSATQSLFVVLLIFGFVTVFLVISSAQELKDQEKPDQTATGTSSNYKRKNIPTDEILLKNLQAFVDDITNRTKTVTHIVGKHRNADDVYQIFYCVEEKGSEKKFCYSDFDIFKLDTHVWIMRLKDSWRIITE